MARTPGLPVEIDLSPTSSGKLMGTLTLPDGQTRDVVVQTQDIFIYPLVVIAAGVLCAFIVKRHVTSGRVLSILKATLLATERDLEATDAEFRSPLQTRRSRVTKS